jgi:hypothetical protein
MSDREVAEQAAATIVNLYVGSAEPRHITYGKVLHVLQLLIAEVEQERRASLLTPSEN